MYCKAKKNFGAIRKFLKIFIFGNLHHKKGLKERISIDADSGPPRYVIWCCGGICGHTVWWLNLRKISKQMLQINIVSKYLEVEKLSEIKLPLFKFMKKKCSTLLYYSSDHKMIYDNKNCLMTLNTRAWKVC